jgi:hypothetical protein
VLSVRKSERSGRDLGRALLREDLTALSWNFLASSGFVSESQGPRLPGRRGSPGEHEKQPGQSRLLKHHASGPSS